MLVPSKYIKTQAERLNVLPAFIYVERDRTSCLLRRFDNVQQAAQIEKSKKEDIACRLW